MPGWHEPREGFERPTHRVYAVLGLIGWCGRVEDAVRAAAREAPVDASADELLALALLGAVGLRRTLLERLAPTAPAEPGAPVSAPPSGGLLR